MSIRILTLFFLLFQVALLFSQQLVPFPGANGLYGYARPDGKPITPPQFKKAWLPTAGGLVLAIDTADQLRVVRHDGIVLPASVPFKSWFAPSVEVATNTRALFALPDTIQNLYCIRSSDGKSFLLVKHGKNGWECRAYFTYETLKTTIPSYGKVFYVNESTGPFTFFQGLYPVVKSPAGQNFVNTELKELFPQDYPNGSILQNGFIALANAQGRFALADAEGNIRTKFQYRSIIGTPNPNAFVVNEVRERNSNRAGLIRADGALVLDTVYDHVAGVNTKWVIAGKNNRYGVLDYQGNIVLPLEYAEITYATGNYFIASKDGMGKTIINHKGQTLLDKKWQSISFYGPPISEMPYYEVMAGAGNPLRGVLDTNLNLLFLDSLSYIRYAYGNFEADAAKGKKYGLYDRTGRKLIPVECTLRERVRNAGYLVAKDSLFGFFSPAGAPVLPIRFTRIMPEVAGDSIILWARPYRDKNLYTAYDIRGKRLPLPEQIAPMLRAVNFKNCFIPEMEQGRWKITLPDGSWVYKPQDYPYKNKNVSTPEGCLMAEFDNGQVRLLDAFLKPIIPEGFSLPEKYYRGRYIQMGLIPVYAGEQSGIIDTRGNWVQKPGPFQYHILGKNIYSEHKGPPSEINPAGATIYTLTADGVQKTAVHYLNDKFREGYLLIGQSLHDPVDDPSFRSWEYPFKYALMDSFGRVCTPFMFAEYPQYKGDRWLARVFAEDLSQKTVLTDYTGRILLDFGEESIFGYDDEQQWIFFLNEEGRGGVRDIEGRTILPARYTHLSMPVSGKLFSSGLPDGKKQLFTPAGKIVLTGFERLQQIASLPDNGYYAIIDNRVYILDPDFNIRASLPGQEVQTVAGFPDLLEVKTEDAHVRYVNFRKGSVFGE